jgi:hypothetical protein
MPATPTRRGETISHAGLKAAGITPDDIDETWLDTMVKRLFAELSRQLTQVEAAKNDKANAQDRAANARTLASLERTLERLAKMEQQRVLMRETKVAAQHDGALAELERRIDRLVTAAGSRGGTEGA